MSGIQRNFNRPNLAPWRYVWSLSQAYQRWPQIYDSADFASVEDDEAWDKIRRDAVFSAAIENRRKSVAGTEWLQQAASDEEQDKLGANIMTDLFGYIHHFYRARYNLTEGIFRGSGYLAISGQWKILSLTGDKPRKWWVPTRLDHIDRWRFRVVRTDWGWGNLDTGWELWSVARHQWERLQNPDHFIRHYYERIESDMGYGRGLLNSLYFWLRAKEVVLAQGLAGVERWAQGLLLCKVASQQLGSPGDTDSEAVRDAFLTEMDKMRSEHVIAFDSVDEVQAIWPSGQGHSMVIDFLTYLDQGAMRLIQSSDLTTGESSSGTGSYAQAKEQGSQKEQYFETDRLILSEDIDYGLGRLTWKMNAHNIKAYMEERALPPARRSEFQISHKPQVVAKDQIEIVTKLLTANVPLVAHEVYDMFGFTQPTPNDEVLTGPEQLQIPAGGWGNGGFGNGNGESEPMPQGAPGEGGGAFGQLDARTNPPDHMMQAVGKQASQSFARYTDVSPCEGKVCSNCEHYVIKGHYPACLIVEGEIAPGGWCRFHQGQRVQRSAPINGNGLIQYQAEVKEKMTPLEQSIRSALSDWTEQKSYPSTDWTGVEDLCRALSTVTNRAAVEAAGWYTYPSKTEGKLEDGKDWRYLVPNGDLGVVSINCHSLLHNDVWTLAITIYSCTDIPYPQDKEMADGNPEICALMWTRETALQLETSGYHYPEVIEELEGRLGKMGMKLQANGNGAVVTVLDAEQGIHRIDFRVGRSDGRL